MCERRIFDYDEVGCDSHYAYPFASLRGRRSRCGRAAKIWRLVTEMCVLLILIGCQNTEERLLPMVAHVENTGRDADLDREINRSGVGCEKWGYVEESGRWRIKARFDYAMPFSRGGAVVLVGDRGGIISRDGRYLVLPSDESLVFGWRNGIIRLGIASEPQYYDRQGRYLSPWSVTVRQAGFWDYCYLEDDSGENGAVKIRNAAGEELRSVGCVEAFQARYSTEGRVWVAVKEEGGQKCWGALGPDGKFQIQPRFRRVLDLDTGYMTGAMKKDKNGKNTWVAMAKDGKPLFTTEQWLLRPSSLPYESPLFVSISHDPTDGDSETCERSVIGGTGHTLMSEVCSDIVIIGDKAIAVQRSGDHWRIYNLKTGRFIKGVYDFASIAPFTSLPLMSEQGRAVYIDIQPDGSVDKIRGAAPESDNRTGLWKRLETLKITDQRLEEAVRILASTIEMPVDVDWTAIDRTGFYRRQWVTTQLSHVCVYDAIAHIFGQAYPLGPSPIVIKEVNGRILVRPRLIPGQ